MKSRDTLIRLKRFQLEEKQRRITQIEGMIAEFGRMVAELGREIAGEEQHSGITDPTHFAYSTYARAARTRRDNLQNSADELGEQLAAAQAELEGARAELHRVESLEGREKGLDRTASVATKVSQRDFDPHRA